MTRRGLAGIALAVALVFGGGATALAASQRALVRGTIESVSGNSLTMKTYDAKTEHLKLGSKTKFAEVVAADRNDIQAGDFVGIGGTGANDKPTALEVVIFPDSMRGTGEGHYPWSVPAFVAATDRHETSNPPTGGPPVHGTMTNGTISSAAPATGGPPVHGTMTNGTVKSGANAAGGHIFTVSYDNGKHIQITVPDNAPVVRFVVATHSALVPGAKAFAIGTRAGGHLDAGFVAVGKNGLMPPM